MHSFAQLLPIFEEEFLNSLPFPVAPVSLYEPCSYLLGLGGKRVRPIACLMSHELFGEIDEDAKNAAKAIELFHNFSLIHDDIMDKAPLRRGFPTVHAKYGLTSGILSGDVMCIYAYHCLSLVHRSLPQVLQLFNKTAIEVCEGQQMDMDFECRNDVSIEEYIHMITLKTSVLLATSMKIGALTGGATTGNADKLYEFGKHVGIAFQLQDDYLDAFGDAQKLGKQNGGDILANKKTFLLIKALELATDEQRTELLYWLEQSGAEKVNAILSLYRNIGVDVLCQHAVHHYSLLAFQYLEEVAVVSKRKEALHELASYLLLRDK
jgi:geranylgeranyl diphosphate synthase type II